MKTMRICLKLSMTILSLALVVTGPGSLRAQEDAEAALDLVVKISKVEETLNLIDELVATTSTGQTTMSPTAMLRGMVQGTDWIDPSRSTVLGVEFIDGQPQMALLIPFQYPSEGFQSAYDASSGPDYYVMGFPPGQGAVVSGAVERAMVAASTSEAKALLSVELAANRLLSKADAQIKQGLDKLVNMPRAQGQGAPDLGPSPEELRQMLVNFLDVARQLETLALGLDIDREALSYFFGAKALPETKLFHIFSDNAETSLLDDYKPAYQINFRSRSFDVEGMMGLMEDCFGSLYTGMGIDFSAMAPIFKSFTGEGAGGVSLAKDGMGMECIYVLKDNENTPDFLEKVYVPWMMKYSEDMAVMLEKNLGAAIESPFVRTEDSTVSGHKVLGIKTQFPVFYGPQFPSTHDGSSLMAYDCRMTTVGNLLLVAGSDARMAELIEIAAGVKERPAEGPLMSGDMDVGGYLAFLADMMPQMAGKAHALPKLGKVTFAGDLKNGEARGRVTVTMDDVKTIAAYFSQSAAAPVASSARVEEEPLEGVEKRESPAAPAKTKEGKAVVLTEESPQYWLNKGGLFAAYGNDRRAVQCFEKAIHLDPRNSDAYFQQGISYGELGRHEEGLSRINKALELAPRQGIYLYGRGRLYLIAGEKGKAIDDFKEAAALGEEEAQDYLQNTSHGGG